MGRGPPGTVRSSLTAHYRLADWAPDANTAGRTDTHKTEDEWVSHWTTAGWRLEFDDGVWVEIGGRRIKRFALIRDAQTTIAGTQPAP